MQCPNCGAPSTGGRFCKYCGTQLPQAVQQPQVEPVYQPPQGYDPNMVQPPVQPQYPYQNPYPQQPVALKKENPLLGMIGAFLGSLIGAASIVLLGQLGFVASLSGWLLALCTLKGYELLGKRVGGFGIAVCVVLMLVMPLVGYVGIYVVELIQEYGATVSEAIPFAVEVALDGENIGSILMIYAFAVIGGIGLISNAIRANKK